LYGQCQAGAQINFPESGRGLGHVPLTIFGSTVGYPSDSLASCLFTYIFGVQIFSAHGNTSCPKTTGVTLVRISAMSKNEKN